MDPNMPTGFVSTSNPRNDLFMGLVRGPDPNSAILEGNPDHVGWFYGVGQVFVHTGLAGPWTTWVDHVELFAGCPGLYILL